MPHGGDTPVVALTTQNKQYKEKGGCAIPPNPKGIGFPCTIIMTVKELISELKDFPENAGVVVFREDNRLSAITSVAPNMVNRARYDKDKLTVHTCVILIGEV